MNHILISMTMLLSVMFVSSNTNQAINAHNLPGQKQESAVGKPSKSYTSTILVDQTPSASFNAIKNFRGWWSEEIQGNTDQLNQTFFYHYKNVHLSKIKLIEIVPDKKLVYQVVDNEFNFTKDKTEWIGTKLIFKITKLESKTKIVFIHEGLVPAYECYKVCNDAWTSYIQGSLKKYIETGKGRPNGRSGGLNAELVEKWGLPNN
ncbi:MAG TPA: SRPBCC domain-containing protein [Chitinophagaceae bacterium]|nr:SRPBCC domain-containing protein [Chitinophagaceae bacterium]